MDHRFGIGLGDDQRVWSVQKGADFRRCRHRFGAAPQHQNVGVGQDAEAGLFRPLQGAALLATRIFEFAHAEESEIVVAQPLEEGDRLVDMVLVERHRRVAEFRDSLVEPGKHRLPVGYGGANLRKNALQALAEAVGRVFRQRPDMHLDDADPVGFVVALGSTGVAQNVADASLAVFHQHHGMQHQRRLAGGFGDLAEDGIKKEGHVIVDDRDHGHRAATPFDAGAGVDRHDALALAVAGNRPPGEFRSPFEHLGLVGGNIFGRRARQQDVRKTGPGLGGFRRFGRCLGGFSGCHHVLSHRMLLRLS